MTINIFKIEIHVAADANVPIRRPIYGDTADYFGTVRASNVSLLANTTCEVYFGVELGSLAGNTSRTSVSSLCDLDTTWNTGATTID